MSLEVLRKANNEQLERAIALNHEDLFCREAMMNGGKVHEIDGLVWTHCDNKVDSMIMFPSLSDDAVATTLDNILNYFVHHPIKGARCWSHYPTQPRDLNIRLLARGFLPGWWPCWMALELDKMNDRYPTPAGLEIIADNDRSLAEMNDLPYASEFILKNERLMNDSEHPRKAQRFIGVMNGEVVGHTTVYFTTGPYGVAGIYNMGVIPSARNQGVAKSVLSAALRYAREHGYHYATLNATGKRMYEQLGFRWIGEGRTWLLKGDQLIKQPPTQREVKMAEAVARGDIKSLDDLLIKFSDKELSLPLTNGFTFVELAVHCKQPSSAYWLIDHGATMRALEAWNLGWKKEARDILAQHRDHVNEKYGEYRVTLLHEAARTNDVELAKLSLSFNPDLTIKDCVHDGTPVDWARFFKRHEMIRLIEESAK